LRYGRLSLAIGPGSVCTRAATGDGGRGRELPARVWPGAASSIGAAALLARVVPHGEVEFDLRLTAEPASSQVARARSRGLVSTCET
jgi:hypothetical protein